MNAATAPGTVGTQEATLVSVIMIILKMHFSMITWHWEWRGIKKYENHVYPMTSRWIRSEKWFFVISKMKLHAVLKWLKWLYVLMASAPSIVAANLNCSYSAANDSLHCSLSKLPTIKSISSQSSGNYHRWIKYF